MIADVIISGTALFQFVSKLGLMRIAISLLLFFICLLPSSSVVGQLHEVEFQDKKTFYLFKDSKTTLRFTGFPYDTDIVQAQVVQSKQGPKARLIGKHNQSPEAAGQRYVDFVVEVLPSSERMMSSIQLQLKAFRKKIDSDSYDIVSDITNYIRTKECPRNGSPVCSLVKIKCREGSNECYNGLKETYKEFASECEAQKAGALIHSYGSCE